MYKVNSTPNLSLPGPYVEGIRCLNQGETLEPRVHLPLPETLTPSSKKALPSSMRFVLVGRF